jgi:hypothetical protein
VKGFACCELALQPPSKFMLPMESEVLTAGFSVSEKLKKTICIDNLDICMKWEAGRRCGTDH